MKLPSWLTGTKTNVLPDPSTHVDFSAESLANLIERGGRFRLVAFPGLDTEVNPVGGHWPLIIRADDPGVGPVTFVTEDNPDFAYYLDATSTVTAAPAE